MVASGCGAVDGRTLLLLSQQASGALLLCRYYCVAARLSYHLKLLVCRCSFSLCWLPQQLLGAVVDVVLKQALLASCSGFTHFMVYGSVPGVGVAHRVYE